MKAILPENERIGKNESTAHIAKSLKQSIEKKTKFEQDQVTKLKKLLPRNTPRVLKKKISKRTTRYIMLYSNDYKERY